MKPIIKWVGGKTQILDKVFDNFPLQINNYHEPFVGGGSVLLELLERVKNEDIILLGNIYAYDKNPVLVHMFLNIKNNHLELLENINTFLDTYISIKDKNGNKNPINEEESISSKESYYYWLRKRYNLLSNEEKKNVYGSALFIFLNKTGFRGLYRVGPNGLNVPFGNYHKLNSIISLSELERIHAAIQQVQFVESNFENSISKLENGDFMYLDPPYVQVKKTSFVNYQSGGFGNDDHYKLFEQIKECDNKGIKFLMSNSDTKIVRENFDTFIINEITCRRAINSKNPDSVIGELLVKNY